MNLKGIKNPKNYNIESNEKYVDLLNFAVEDMRVLKVDAAKKEAENS